MQAGLYDENPRAREIVYILIAQRAARGLGSLYAQANMMSMEDAGKIHSEYTPRGWMKTEKELLIFEQHLYLRQPGYGTSYITGKYLIEETLAEVAKEQEKKGYIFTLQYPSYIPFLTYADNRELRKKMAIAGGKKAFQDHHGKRTTSVRPLDVCARR